MAIYNHRTKETTAFLPKKDHWIITNEVVTPKNARQIADNCIVRRLRKESIDVFFYTVKEIETAVKSGLIRKTITRSSKDIPYVKYTDVEQVFKEVTHTLKQKGWKATYIEQKGIGTQPYIEIDWSKS
jgi:hypothetical protein